MRPPRHHLVMAVAAGLIVAACGGGTPVDPSAPAASGGASPEASSGTWARASTFQALPPQNVFTIPPAAVVTDDGSWVTPGPMLAIYPGPLLPNLVARTVTDAGREAINAEAARLGLLDGQTDFTGGASVPGGITGRIELTVDGAPVTLTGNPGATIMCIQAPCEPPPGTPEAFADLFAKLQAPESWLEAGLGAQEPYVASSYAILVGPPPAQEGITPAAPIVWPLADQPLATFGGPVLDGTYRCGIVGGVDAATLRPSLESANQLSQWVQDASTSATFGLAVQPIVADENPCATTFGGG